MINVTLVRAEKLTPNISSFYFRPVKPTRYIAGQFIELFLPHDNPDVRGIKRWFTLSSSPTDELLSITTRHDPERSSSFKNALFNLPVGTELKMAEAMGDFVLPKDQSIPLVFVAAGMGITPYHSMLKWLADRSEKRDIKLLIGVRDPSDIIYRDTYEHYGIVPEIIVSQPTPDWLDETGHISADRIMKMVDRPSTARIYISGPEAMVELLEKKIKLTGFNTQNLVLDFFPNYNPI